MNNLLKTDKELVTLLVSGDEPAFCELYIRYKERLSRFCYTFLKSYEETEDIIQEIFTNLWESHDQINPDLSFSSYLHTIAYNRIISYFRNLNVENKVKSVLAEKDSSITVDSIVSDIVYAEYQAILHSTTEKLPPQRKRIFNLSRQEGLTHKEIADKLGISVYTVQEHISESLRFIKTKLSKYTEIGLCVALLFPFLT